MVVGSSVWQMQAYFSGLAFRFSCLSLWLPSVSNVQVEPIVVNIDKLDLMLVETDDSENLSSPTRL